MRPDDNLAILSAAPRQLVVGGKHYPVSKLTPRSAGRLQALVMDRVPDPRDKIRSLMEGLPDAVQIHMWQGAVEEAKHWPPSLGDPKAQAVLMSADGMALMVELTVAPNIAGFTREQCGALADAMQLEDFETLMELAAPGSPHDPKAGAATAARHGAS